MKKAWLWMELLFAFAAAMLVITACVHFIPKAEDHDVWDIATAIGTVGAAVAAVWIATKESRRRKKETLEIAHLTAASMVWRLTNDAAQVELTLEWLETMVKKISSEPKDFAAYGTALALVADWTLHDLLPLAPLPQQCAVKLAIAGDQVKICAFLLKSADQGGLATSGLNRMNTAIETYKILKEARPLLVDAMKQCRLAANKIASA